MCIKNFPGTRTEMWKIFYENMYRFECTAVLDQSKYLLVDNVFVSSIILFMNRSYFCIFHNSGKSRRWQRVIGTSYWIITISNWVNVKFLQSHQDKIKNSLQLVKSQFNPTWDGAWGGGGARGEKTCCISENFCLFYMKFCTYAVLTIWNKSREKNWQISLLSSFDDIIMKVMCWRFLRFLGIDVFLLVTNGI